ncbi:glucose dehydrogenase [FAD, quinone]-like [Aphidius gifuensis]|nr:glucose dehydrogenase [FAD, quinone]-like [Aphidius gifuensis]XP_044002230.1 glucose dehydrogenase [FAD, quinone]-like [Aphidius gifuensis]
MKIIITSIITLLITIKLSSCDNFFDLPSSYDIPTKKLPTHAEYDFIIVGAGSGGSPVTNRLSENKNWNILLLEAGKHEGIFNQIPVLATAFQFSNYNWGYRVEPSKNACLGMKDKRCTWPRGKSLGGTSTLNNMIHTRGNKLDFDKWSEMGNYGWSFNEVLPYFKKSEKFHVTGKYDKSYHNSDGNVCVEYSPYQSPLATTFLRAGQQLGYNITDVNGAEQVGFSYVPFNLDKGARCSAAKAYLRVKRSNLDIVTEARVLRVLINSQNKAYGVEYEKKGEKYKVYSSKEIILSAGTIDTPKLLMLSGIGPKEHLKKLGIPVVKDSQVGGNLQEHIGFWGLTFLVNKPVTLMMRRIFTLPMISKYLFKRNGPFSLPGGPESIAFLKTKYANDSRPDVEVLFIGAALNTDYGIAYRRGYGISDDVYYKIYKPIEGKDTFTIWPILQYPKSRGKILLRSKNPNDDPIINGNFFDDPLDVEIILEGIKYAIELVDTEPFKEYSPKINTLKVPGCDHFNFGSDDYWRCAIRHIPAMENHEVGTVKMGPIDDPSAVVDPELKVYGVDGLRCSDASIMPLIPAGHINANIYMIGEKAADMIIKKYQGY